MPGPLKADALYRLVPVDDEAVEQGLPMATTSAIGAVLGMSRSAIQRSRREGFSVWQAERYALRFGLMPEQVWAEWDELCNEACGVVTA